MFKSVENMVFNGINLSEQFTDEETGAYFIVNEVRGRGVQGEENTLIGVGGMDGAYLSKRQRPVRYLEVDITLKGVSFEDLRRRIDRLSGILDTGKEIVPITFEDESGRTYYGKLDAVVDRLERAKIYQATLTFVCPDPYKYGPEKIIEPSSDTFIVENNGTAEADPIIELEVLQPTTFAMISNGDEYMMVGTPADVNMTVVNPKTELLYENGETIGDWTQTPPDWGGSEGTIGYDGAGITAPSYGTGTGYHGPSVFKEISATQDFEVELRGQLYTDHVNQTGRFGFFLFDEQMRQIAFMAAIDNSAYVNRKLAEGRIGPYIGDFKNYLISSRNYQKEWDNFPAYLRLRRIGDTYTFYVARILGDGRHMEPLTASWTVWEDKFRGRLKYVGIFIEKYGDTQSPHTNRIDYIKVHALQQTTEDKTPYIAQPGDVIEFDHVTKDIRLNGESRKDLKAFGGSFFTLKNGINTLTVMPENTFNTKITYRERYK